MLLYAQIKKTPTHSQLSCIFINQSSLFRFMNVVAFKTYIWNVHVFIVAALTFSAQVGYMLLREMWPSACCFFQRSTWMECVLRSRTRLFQKYVLTQNLLIVKSRWSIWLVKRGKFLLALYLPVLYFTPWETPFFFFLELTALSFFFYFSITHVYVLSWFLLASQRLLHMGFGRWDL